MNLRGREGGERREGGREEISRQISSLEHSGRRRSHLVKTAAPFSPRWSRAGCCKRRASRKFWREEEGGMVWGGGGGREGGDGGVFTWTHLWICLHVATTYRTCTEYDYMWYKCTCLHVVAIPV